MPSSRIGETEFWVVAHHACKSNGVGTATNSTGKRIESISQQGQWSGIKSENSNVADPGQPGLQSRESQPGDYETQFKTIVGNAWSENWLEVATRFCRVDDWVIRRFYTTIKEYYECQPENKMGSEKSITEDGTARWEALQRLWKQRKSATPSSFLYQLGLCDTLPDVSCETRSTRWVAQEETAKKLRDLWQKFYAMPFKEAQNVQSKLLEQIGEIERNEAVVIKKDDKDMHNVWARVYLPTGKTNNMYEELRKQTGVEKKEIYIISEPQHRVNRLKALGNSIVPQIAAIIMQAIKETTNQ